MTARTSNPVPIPEVSFGAFLEHFKWRQGEHVSILGPTGSGKTTLARHLLSLDKRKNVAFVATKPSDPVVSDLRRDGFTVIREWPKHVESGVPHKFVLWPPYSGEKDLKLQQRIVQKALENMFAAGGWTIVFDELYYIANMLNLTSGLKLLWQQGRAIGITVVALTQRPAYVPLEMYDQATHLFLFRTRDEPALKRISGMGGADNVRVKQGIKDLETKHDLVYVNAGTGNMVSFRPESLDGISAVAEGR